MANKALFKSVVGKMPANTDTLNEAGSGAYALSNKHALAQYAVTGCFNNAFYSDATLQLNNILDITQHIEPQFIAKTAIYARQRGYMKDVPALLTAVLASNSDDFVNDGLMEKTFKQVIDNGKMLRNFVQIMRSGVIGRKSLGSKPKRQVQKWLNEKSDSMLIHAAVGNSPSLSDVIKMTHPKPNCMEREALLGYMINRRCRIDLLPASLQLFEDYKKGKTQEIPNVPFQMLTALKLNDQAWTTIACNAGWQMTRMNLNTFARHNVFKIGGMKQRIAERLRNAELIRKANAFPYQLLNAYLMCNAAVPEIVRDALHDAMETALENVAKIAGKVFVLPDVSGSMQSPITGYRQGATSAVRCIDIAALFTAALVRKNPDTEVLPFDTSVHKVRFSQRDTVMANAEKLAHYGGGGTNCSLPLAKLNRQNAKADMIIYISDNQSWVDNTQPRATQTLIEWEIFKRRNPQAKLVCIDIQPYQHTQVNDQKDVLNIGGFSDQVFKLIAKYANGEFEAGFWVNEIEKIVI